MSAQQTGSLLNVWFKKSELLLFAFHSATVDPETLPLSLWLISHLSALYLLTGGCCHCLPPSELPGDCCSSIHFRYKDKQDDSQNSSGIVLTVQCLWVESQHLRTHCTFLHCAQSFCLVLTKVHISRTELLFIRFHMCITVNYTLSPFIRPGTRFRTISFVGTQLTQMQTTSRIYRFY